MKLPIACVQAPGPLKQRITAILPVPATFLAHLVLAIRALRLSARVVSQQLDREQ
ncbi:hypothetical protein ACFVYG_16440 [Streptomyces sp. NPDC058256]|uniref:hypothetical protein n=1 Tax=Streptomyces sp. NPDC058256 TaxID=3346408 RepID=UPI0036E0DCF0